MLLGETTLTETADGAELIVQQDLKGQQTSLDEIDRFPGAVRFPDGEVWKTESVEMARLAIGLWERCGSFEVEADALENTVPVEVACGARADVAAFLTVDPSSQGHRSRAGVADLMGLDQRQSVSNYLVEVRMPWDEIVEAGES